MKVMKGKLQFVRHAISNELAYESSHMIGLRTGLITYHLICGYSVDGTAMGFVTDSVACKERRELSPNLGLDLPTVYRIDYELSRFD